MRILMVRSGVHFSTADVERGWTKALGRLVTVADYNLDDRIWFYSQAHREDAGEWKAMVDSGGAVRLAAKGISAACYEFAPDVVVFTSCFYVGPEVLDMIRAHGTAVVIIHTESPYEDDRQVARAEHADLNIVNDPTNLARFPHPSLYMPHAYDPEVHHPRTPDPDRTSDFCFVGTGYPSRIAFLESVDWTGINVALAGNWEGLKGHDFARFVKHPLDHCLDNTDAVDLYAGTKVSANLYRHEAQRPELSQGWAMGPREVELAACGTFFLREPRGEGDEILPFVPTFDGPEDFTDKLRWYLAHEDERQVVADKARGALADRTFDANARHLLRLLDGR